MKPVLSLLGAGALLVATTGCDRLASKAMETAIERAVNAQGDGNVDIDLRGGQVTIRDQDGSASTVNYAAGNNGVELPRNFPSGELPLPNGKLIMAMGGNGGYILTYESNSAGEFDRLTELLTSQGYKETHSMNTSESHMVLLEGDKWTISLTAGKTEPYAMNYAAHPRNQ